MPNELSSSNADPSFFQMKSFCWIILVLLGTCISTSESSRRPKPSKILPILDLVEPKGSLYDPKPEDTDLNRLRQLLGEHFDSGVMSESEPETYSQHPNGTVKMSLKRTRSGHVVPDGPPPKHIKRMQLRTVRFGNGKRVQFQLGKKMKRRFRDFLWLQSYCPLLQKWRDLGPRFWPRWFLENSCASRTTCSFPKGMVCKPHKSVDKVLLRWHCQNWDLRSNCEWLKVQYPLVTECRCGC